MQPLHFPLKNAVCMPEACALHSMFVYYSPVLCQILHIRKIVRELAEKIRSRGKQKDFA